jgi:hypothetical protein
LQNTLFIQEIHSEFIADSSLCASLDTVIETVLGRAVAESSKVGVLFPLKGKEGTSIKRVSGEGGELGSRTIRRLRLEILIERKTGHVKEDSKCRACRTE